MKNKFNIVIGNRINQASSAASAEVSNRSDASLRNAAIFNSILQTWAAFIPADYKEVNYLADPDRFSYTMHIANVKNPDVTITISWANDFKSKAEVGILINSEHYSDLAEALRSFNLQLKED